MVASANGFHEEVQGDTPLLQESDSAGSDDEVVLDEGSLLKATSLRRREASRAAAAAQLDAHPDAENPSLLQQLQGFRRRFQLRQVFTALGSWSFHTTCCNVTRHCSLFPSSAQAPLSPSFSLPPTPPPPLCLGFERLPLALSCGSV